MYNKVTCVVCSARLLLQMCSLAAAREALVACDKSTVVSVRSDFFLNEVNCVLGRDGSAAPGGGGQKAQGEGGGGEVAVVLAACRLGIAAGAALRAGAGGGVMQGSLRLEGCVVEGRAWLAPPPATLRLVERDTSYVDGVSESGWGGRGGGKDGACTAEEGLGDLFPPPLLPTFKYF